MSPQELPIQSPSSTSTGAYKLTDTHLPSDDGRSDSRICVDQCRNRFLAFQRTDEKQCLLWCITALTGLAEEWWRLAATYPNAELNFWSVLISRFTRPEEAITKFAELQALQMQDGHYESFPRKCQTLLPQQRTPSFQEDQQLSFTTKLTPEYQS